MSHARRLTLALVTSGALAVGVVGNALAGDDPPAFGQHVAMCAQDSLGKDSNPPAVTCTHDGQTMTFATFGEMVQYMKEHHG